MPMVLKKEKETYKSTHEAYKSTHAAYLYSCNTKKRYKYTKQKCYYPRKP